MQLKTYRKTNCCSVDLYINGDKYASFQTYGVSCFSFLVPNYHMMPLLTWMSYQVNPQVEDLELKLVQMGWTER